VLFSAWLPARKAAKTPAIIAIKGTGDLKRRREKAKNARIIGKIFGFEGMLASKQLKRSRRHFRATVISITTSIVLILASVSLSTHMSRSFEGRILQIGAPTAALGLFPLPGTRTIGLDAETFTQITRAMREFPDTFIAANAGSFFNSIEHGIAMAVVPTTDTYMELLALAGANYGANLLINVQVEVDASGNLVQYNPFDFTPGEVFRLYRQERTADGFVWASEADYITIHGIVNELPNHLMQLSESILMLIVPDGEIQALQWGANTLDPEGFIEFAKEIFHSHYTLGEGEELVVADFAEAIQLLRIMIDSALAYVRIFSIMLIFLGLTNVISTIATSVKLRGREFAVLTSVGMERGGLRRMLAFESLISSAQALIFGLPIGFGMSYLMYMVGEISNPIGIVFTPPWIAMVICAAGVVVITFVIMQISAMAVKRSNLIETIRGAE
ncbi:MAG: ABC transporter permease, partial [Defluviitaleaceae bacterium]|nr:ABC transporter permease [Defluviitaleaceae bacterium]